MATLFPNQYNTDRRKCKRCGKLLAASYEGEVCVSCLDDELYHEVKDYILTHSVTAKEVAEAFDIPLDKVKGWIRDGFIEYRPRWN